MKHEAVQQWLDLQFGLFIHFGLYSLPGGVWKGERITRGYSEQILSHGYLPQADYEALTEQFSLPEFNPKHIVTTAKQAGMRYLVITTKHHDGFCLFDTNTTDYKSTNAACKRDIVKDLSDECKKQGLAFGIYFSWIDWHFSEAAAISSHNSDPIPSSHQRLNIAQLTELLSNYGPMCELWMDMGAPTAEQSQEVYDLVQSLQPQCMVNGRIWNDKQDFLTMGDNQLPAVPLNCPWQTPASIYKETWGYRSWQVRGDRDEKIQELSDTARKVVQEGGNYLLNIGLMGTGAIQSFEQEVLEGIGTVLAKNPLKREQNKRILPKIVPGQLCAEPLVAYRYTGTEYYSYRPIPTTLCWALQLNEDTSICIGWESDQGLAREQKLCLEIAGKQYYSSLQKGRTSDTFITALKLKKGKHEICLHTIGDELKRPELVDTTLRLVLRKEGK
ncbi:alpha-L-fucosidase [Sphaerochaeta globosa]|uniref:alpha-L-fucosidase n=1 Tax=Sphaerochaeta globosa (strain ATCC BAA-1886 / DSM 22777 / Buddy) TaxID=158189 RepID=F0RXW4_SPHGB|nr:alpha-L-fucosidase [Sphaerochaeta globosa]ADY12241.1 glycoside hydrolase family 29 (alpha-L-fucosidase) [Sphaerochaeta globosa str. Buddy]